MSTNFYEDVSTILNASLNTYVSDVSTKVIESIYNVTITLLTIYVVMWGIAMIMGKISEPVLDGVIKIVRLSVIVAIALNVGRYNQYLSDFLWGIPDAMAAVITSASGNVDNVTNANFLDSLWAQIYDIGYAFWNISSGVLAIGTIIMAYFIWFAGAGVTVYAFFLLILSKIALAILLGIGPIFVLLIIFEPTKRFFDVWMGQVLNYVFVVILTAAAMRLMLTILTTYLAKVVQSGFIADPTIPVAIPIVIYCVISFLVLLQVPSIASALGGGTSIGTLGAVGWAYGKTTGTMGAMRPTNLRRSLNKAKSDERIVRGISGAVFRKITGSTVNRVSK